MSNRNKEQRADVGISATKKRWLRLEIRPKINL
jgi:hypothetical protein